MTDLKIIESESKTENENYNEKEINSKKVGWCTIIKNKGAFFGLCCIFIGTYNKTFWSCFVESYFHRMGNEHLAGVFLFSIGMFYIFCCIILPYTCENAPRKLIFCLTFIGFGLCCMLIGPSYIFGLYDSSWSSACVPDEEGGKQCYLFSPRIYVVGTGFSLLGFF